MQQMQSNNLSNDLVDDAVIMISTRMQEIFDLQKAERDVTETPLTRACLQRWWIKQLNRFKSISQARSKAALKIPSMEISMTLQAPAARCPKAPKIAKISQKGDVHSNNNAALDWLLLGDWLLQSTMFLSKENTSIGVPTCSFSDP